MNSGIIVIGILIIVISAIIYIVKNQQEIREKLTKVRGKKFIKFIYYILLIIICIMFIKYFYNFTKNTKTSLQYYKDSLENWIFFEECDEKVDEENDYYNEAIQKEYGDILKEPYIPNGFEYVEGDIFSGYVIQDSEGNQYVWVPCTNKEDEKIVKLGKRDFFNISNEVSIRNYICFDIEYEEFIQSALENGGFYISRFELGKEDDGKIVSKANTQIWSNITRVEAIEIIKNMYTDLNCNLINGYAYDTALTWVEKTNNIEKEYYEDLNNIKTGRKKYNNIYDLTDNIMEITLENSYDTIIYRGFSNSEEIELNSRYSTEDKKYENYEYLVENNFINLFSFRTVIYK